MFNSFQSRLPWSHCENDWNTEACFSGLTEPKAINCTNGFFIVGNITKNCTGNGTVTVKRVSAIVEFWE